MSLREVSAATGISYSEIARIERNLVSEVPAIRLFEICAAVGLDASLRMYPSGDPIRDRAQHGLLERLRARISPSLRWRTEVPLPIEGDRRAWDARISGYGWSIVVEAETHLWDLQAIERRIELKARDAGASRLILLVADTRANRLALRTARESLRDRFPLDSRELLGRLGQGSDPGGGGIVIL